MPLLLENRALKPGLFFMRPIAAGSTRVPQKASSSPAAIQATAALKPMVVSSTPPRKKPTHLRAFLEPVRIATQRNSCCSPLL